MNAFMIIMIIFAVLSFTIGVFLLCFYATKYKHVKETYFTDETKNEIAE